MGIGAGVAVVGIGCRLPGGVNSQNQYWDFMLRHDDGIVEVPAERWNAELVCDADPDAPGRAHTRHGGFVTMSQWDFGLPGIPPGEAAVMDPKERLALRVAWEALDDAGMAGVLSGRDVGVYVGAITNDNETPPHVSSAMIAMNRREKRHRFSATVADRLSRALNLRGPTLTIDTACASSLVAIHEATLALVRGECGVALAGGVDVMLHPEVFAGVSRCKPAAAPAEGYGCGEGAGMIVLKPVEAAVRDGDRIYAVIEGSGTTHDGRATGVTAPNRRAQHDLALRVCAQAGLTPGQIGYVEAHGTGAALGDAIELAALGEAYGRAESRSHVLLVGSVRAAIGHLEAAAGVAGVMKAALALHHRTIPPQPKLDILNPALPFAELNVEVVTTTTAFPTSGGPAIAAVNGFGHSGTNAHVILTQAPQSDLPATAVCCDLVSRQVESWPWLVSRRSERRRIA